MKYKILDVETQLFKHNIIQLDDETVAKDYARCEEKMIAENSPYYVQLQLDANDLKGIHAFESLGFHFIEFRIFRHQQLVDQAISSRYFFPFGCELLGDDNATRKAIFEITAHHGSHDRFTRDPLISNELAKKRLELYISKSLESYPKQFVYGLVNQQSGELIGIRNGILTDPGIVKYFYTFMKKGYNDPKYTAMLETCVQEALSKRKINRVEAISSGSNVQEMNDTTHLQGFIVDRTTVLLRKIFK
jgi:hypothetical protein